MSNVIDITARRAAKPKVFVCSIDLGELLVEAFANAREELRHPRLPCQVIDIVTRRPVRDRAADRHAAFLVRRVGKGVGRGRRD